LTEDDILPPLAEIDYQTLKSSIARDGQKVPILIDEDTGEVVDGRHRLRACQELGIEPLFERRRFATPHDVERAHVLLNLARRHLSREQRQEVVQKLRLRGWTQAEIAEALGVSRETVSDDSATIGKITNSCILDQRYKLMPAQREEVVKRYADGKTQEQIAADFGVKRQTIAKILAKQKQEAKRRAERELLAQQNKVDGDVLWVGDFYQLCSRIPPDSVDLIFTDPPYDADSIVLYARLSEVAARVLKPGGLCLAYSGERHLPQAIAALSERLSYLWLACIRHSGGELRFRDLHIYNGWKPIIICGKDPIEPWWDWFSDTYSGGKEKENHPWQQAVSEAEHFIAALCPPGGLVLDPMCGSGTTLVAAKSLSRRYLGIDLDSDAVKTSLARLMEVAI